VFSVEHADVATDQRTAVNNIADPNLAGLSNRNMDLPFCYAEGASERSTHLSKRNMSMMDVIWRRERRMMPASRWPSIA
jgi:hypothetical protein